jgi:hypothetical protein
MSGRTLIRFAMMRFRHSGSYQISACLKKNPKFYLGPLILASQLLLVFITDNKNHIRLSDNRTATIRQIFRCWTIG